jgi:hypothetical protein
MIAVAAIALVVAAVLAALLLRERKANAALRAASAATETLLEAERARFALVQQAQQQAEADHDATKAALDEALRQQDTLADDLISEREQREAEITRARSAQMALADEIRTVRDHVVAAQAETARVRADHESMRRALAGAWEELAAERASMVGQGLPPSDAALVSAVWASEVRRAHRRWREIVPALYSETDGLPSDTSVAEQLAAVVRWTTDRLREEAGTHTAAKGIGPEVSHRTALVADILMEELATALTRRADAVEVELSTTDHGWLAITLRASADEEVDITYPAGIEATAALLGATLHLDPREGERVQARLYLAP